VYGTYFPVIFKNLTDLIISGCNKLGINKVFYDINVNINNKDSAYNAHFSWRGTTFFST